AAEADADFAQAATLSPDELDRFVGAGWWVMGPYPPDPAWYHPAEHNPDPSRPGAPPPGSSAEVRWHPVPTEESGRVALAPVLPGTTLSACALTYGGPPDARTAELLVGGQDRVRLWLNGTLVYETATGASAPPRGSLDRVPVTLRAGRNTLLAKVAWA